MTTPTQGEHAQTDLSHELFAAAQLAPGEGIEDAVSRIAAALTADTAQPAPQGVAYALPDFDTVEQHIYGACRRHITQDMLEPIHNLIREAVDADRAHHGQAPAGAAVPTDEQILDLAGKYWVNLDETERLTEIALVRDALAKWGAKPLQTPTAQAAPAAGAVAGPTDATRNAWQQGYAQGVASALPSKVTPDMRRVFREGYREGGFWSDRLDYALEKMLAAAPTPAAQSDSVLEDAALSTDDAALLEKAIADFEECGETDVPDADLRRFAAAGYLECVHYHVMPAAQEAIDAARKQGGKHD